MKIVSDCHTHTVWSDGKQEGDALVRAAIEKGLKRVVITEHGPRHLKAGLRGERIDGWLRMVDGLSKQYAGQIEVLPGIEANLVSLDGVIDVPTDRLADFAVVGVGYHLSGRGMRFIDNLFFQIGRRISNKAAASRRMTDAMIAAIEKNAVSFVTHPGHHLALEYGRLAAAAARRGTALEISARRGHLVFGAEDVKTMKSAGARFIINSDGHKSNEVGVFDQALALAEQAGLSAQDVVNAAGYTGVQPKGL
ncbi:MAG: PHP domain-containing protein [Clostridia bacterium]|nr:PHP domain-containing protein [Clostridia bacterium]